MPTRSIFLVLAVVTGTVIAVDLSTCNVNVQARLDNQTLAFNDPIFFFNGTSYMSQRDNLRLTINGCRATCPKPNFDLYKDMWPRLLTWLIPALLLVGNLHIPRVGGLNRLFVAVHFVGDPIDSMWSLLTKGEVWNRFYSIAMSRTASHPDHEQMARALAAMLSAFEELTGDMASVQQEFDTIMADNDAQLSKEELDYILRETAEELVDSRSNEVLRTLLVIINYLWAVLGAIVPKIGGTQSSQPGGRIGTAMSLSWLVTMVLLSNTLSGFTSRRTCLRIMERYCRTLKGRRRDLHVFPNSPRLKSQSSWFLSKSPSPLPEDFISSQPWNGSVYSFRYRKRLISSGTNLDRSPAHLLALSVAPVLIAAACAFVIIWFTPTVGLGCRTLWVIGEASALLISPLCTWLISKMGTGKVAWYLTIVKDATIGIPLLVIIILSSIGIFNTCWCWSGVYSRGYAKAFVTLDPLDERAYNLHHIYPAMVVACLTLQLTTYFLMFRIMQPGAKVFRPDEDEKMETYRRIHGLGSPTLEMGSKSEAPRPRQAPNEAPELLLPAPAISPYSSPVLSPRIQLTKVISGPSDDSARWSPSVRGDFSYGESPNLQSQHKPLLGSPVWHHHG